VRGAWLLSETERAPLDAPFPGVLAARTPLAWFDSLAIAPDAPAAWHGFESALAHARAFAVPPDALRDRHRARADLTLMSGSSAYEENALTVRRADSLGWVRAEAESWRRGGVGALTDAGRHLYGVAAALARGRHGFEGSFAHRAAAAGIVSGERQAASGAAGHLGYALRLGALDARVTAGQAYDAHESFGGRLAFSRRDARGRQAALEVGGSGPSWWEARLSWRDAKVVRATDGSAAREDRASWLWSGVRGERPFAHGRLEAALGGGHHDRAGGFELAPALGYRWTRARIGGRVVVSRALAPVWSDLAAGQDPFLQTTWSGGLEAGVTAASGSRARLAWLMGRTRQRAVVERSPLEELWLRSGFAADPGDYDFGLLTGQVVWQGMHGAAGAEAFALARDRSAIQAAVDPGYGGRGHLEGRGRVFRGDLEVRLRAEAEVVGPRQSQAVPPRSLAGYVTWGMTAVFTLADLTLALRARNLEDERRLQTWVDPTTGVEALGAEREFRLAMTWRLFD
jgi:hypothetical protein